MVGSRDACQASRGRKGAAAARAEMKTDSERNETCTRRRGRAALSPRRQLQQPSVLLWKGLTPDSKVNPDVLLLLISVADEWEGKITGASQGGPVRCPATQELPSSLLRLSQQQRGMRRPAERESVWLQ